MKRFMLFMLTMMVGVSALCAQTQKELAKERQLISKMSKAELSAKASKAALKAAKEYKKEGWVVAPGNLPLEKQLDRAYAMQYEYDELAFPKYIMAEAMSIGENYDAAKHQALALARLNLAGQVQSEITAITENSLANKQLSNEQAASLAETISASKDIISQSIGRVIPVVECYRTKSNKNREVRVMIAYNSKMAMEAAKNTIRQQLEEKGDELHKQLDKVLGF